MSVLLVSFGYCIKSKSWGLVLGCVSQSVRGFIYIIQIGLEKLKVKVMTGGCGCSAGCISQSNFFSRGELEIEN